MSDQPALHSHTPAAAAAALELASLAAPAQSIVEATARIYLHHTSPWFIGLVAHGSAVKGSKLGHLLRSGIIDAANQHADMAHQALLGRNVGLHATTAPRTRPNFTQRIFALTNFPDSQSYGTGVTTS